MLGQLNDHQVNNLLSSQEVGRLACADGEQPYIVPVTYTYDGNYIYGQTNEGTKLDMLRRNPRVCFEVDMMTDMRNWQSVIVDGQFEELTDVEALKARDILFRRVFSLITSSTLYGNGQEENGELDGSTRIKHIMYRININKATGRFEKQ